MTETDRLQITQFIQEEYSLKKSINNRRDIKIISIEANIGAGKSTLLTNLSLYIKNLETEEKYYNINKKIVILKEPTDEWEKIKDPLSGKNMIELFYENPTKWAYSFQIMVFTTQEKLIENTLQQFPECEIIISERSIDAGKNVFTEMLSLNNDCINIVEHQIYNLLINNSKFKLYASIYIDINPDVCIQRILKRGRPGENQIQIEYLQQCDYYYRNWLIDKRELYQYPEKVFIVNDNNISIILPILMPLIENILHI